MLLNKLFQRRLGVGGEDLASKAQILSYYEVSWTHLICSRTEWRGTKLLFIIQYNCWIAGVAFFTSLIVLMTYDCHCFVLTEDNDLRRPILFRMYWPAYWPLEGSLGFPRLNGDGLTTVLSPCFRCHLAVCCLSLGEGGGVGWGVEYIYQVGSNHPPIKLLHFVMVENLLVAGGSWNKSDSAEEDC